MPTRLISVANHDLKLVLTQGWKTRLRYSTLSHCWGNEPFLQLVAHNYSDFLTGINMENLPKTFQDAIQITRDLGIDYIWIDSLCIIQGDVKDWEREAGAMSMVYGGSFLNIAAASSMNAHGGLFTCPEVFIDGLQTHVTVRGRRLGKEIHDIHLYHRSVTGSHLATRAWTLQEKLLAPRTLHIGDRGGFWECRSKTASECLPLGFESLYRLMESQKENDTSMHAWQDIVEVYSAANLSHTTDKLPGLAGIARKFYEDTKDRYLAGLWENSELSRNLCWAVSSPRAHSGRSPSWSWASIDGPVYYHNPKGSQGYLNHFPIRLLEANMSFRTGDPFGDVHGGSLRFACSGLLPAEICLINDHVIAKFQTGQIATEMPIQVDYLNSGLGRDDRTVYLLPVTYEKGTECHVDTGGEDGMSQLLHVNYIQGLVLQKSLKSKAFQRIGTSTLR